MRKTTVALFVACTASMLACGGGGTTTVGSGATTTTTAVPVTTTAAVTTTTRATGATTTVAGCAAGALPAGATDVTSAAGNFDGDGKPDTLQAYKTAGVWHLRTQLTAGGNTDAALPEVAATETVKALGGFNIDANLVDEAFATVGSGAYTTLVGIWQAAGCTLTRLTIKAERATFPVGASVRNRAGLRCVAGTAVQGLEAQSNADGTVFTGSIGNYDVVGTALVLANSSPPQTFGASDPAGLAYGQLTCGSLKLG
ncbi:MAG: hypothetical protein M3066_12575 [Actinomycetota bacterium]|nr:hypothetical protein [Actinomycetota bacterium]